MRLALLICTLFVSSLAAAQAVDPDGFDPLLDRPPVQIDRDRRSPQLDPRSPGFAVSTHAGMYFGAVRSSLTAARSKLESAGRGNFGFGLGGRTPSLIELGIDFDLGLGQTWEPDFETYVFAFDLLIEPRVFAHYYETPNFSAYAGLTALGIMFDVELAGLNQAGLGPGALLGVQWRLDRHSLLYIELSGTAFHDFLAYHREPPSEEALLEDPAAEPEKVYGEWFGIFRLTVGYRLTAL